MMHSPLRPPPQRTARRQRAGARGLSIVELMVAVAIGLFILAGSTMMLTTQLGDNRRLLLEAQMQQDLRAVADMIGRDLRRAGYWAQSYCQVWPSARPPGSAACPVGTNPYNAMVPAAAASGTSTLVYDRSTDEENNPIGTDDNIRSANERVGFRLNGDNGTIEVQVSEGNWQALTDPGVLRITQFTVTLNARSTPLPCGVNCPVSPGGCPLLLTARDATVVIVAQAVHEPTLQRTLRDIIRLRNDVPRANC